MNNREKPMNDEPLTTFLNWKQVADHVEYFKIDREGKNGTGMFNRLIKQGISTHNVNIIIAGMLINPVLTVALANGDRLPKTARQALREHPVEAAKLKKIANKRYSETKENSMLPRFLRKLGKRSGPRKK